jgi:O-antigen/teichoic acid export membrane protein
MIYGLSSIVGRFLNYLLVPLYTYTLVSSGNYGVVTNVYAYTALLLVLLTFGMETTFFYFANNNKENYQKVFSTSLYMVGSVCVCFLALVMVFSTSISSALGYNEHPEYIRIMATVVSFDAFQAILFAYLRFQGRAWKFAALKLLFIVMNIGINLFVFITIPHIKVSNPDTFNWYTPEKQVYYIFLINMLCTAPITLALLP